MLLLDNGKEEYSTARCCCFTGHRPEKLSQSETVVLAALEHEILRAVAAGITGFISGMARGVDIWAAELVLRLSTEGRELHLICAIPFPGFERGWSADWQQRYRSIIVAADQVEFICPEKSSACYQLRNEWMVDRSSRVIAVYNGESGGTKNTVDYAKKKGVPVVHAMDQL